MNFHSINWLYAGVAAVALLAIAYAWADKQRAKSLAEFASAKLLPELSRTVSPIKIFIKKLLFALGVLAVFVALARPQWGYRWEETKSRGIDVIFAIDTSKSMLAEDVKPNRLDRAKLSVMDLLNVLNGDRIGIVAFSGQAFLQCPLTLDYDAFRMSLEALDTNVIQRGGTNIAAAIEEAEVAFAKTSNKKVVVLISDGEELESSALERAKEAAKNGVVIYTLGVGGARGEAIPVRDSTGRIVQLRDESGKIVTSKLNEEVLSKIAKITGGFYEPLTANGMDTIYEEGLKKIPQHELSARMKQLAIERFQIPLTIAILLLALESLIGTRRFFANKRNSTIPSILVAVLIPMFALAPQESKAEDKQIEIAPQVEELQKNTPQVKEESAEQKPMSSVETFNAAIEEANNGDKQKAKDLFAESIKMSPEDFSLHSKAFYNVGNIEYEASKHSLEKANTTKEYVEKIAQADQLALNAMAQGAGLLQQGAPLLKAEQEAVAKAKNDEEKKKALETSPLKNKQFQEQLKGGISACEAAEKGFAEAKKSTSENIAKWKNAKSILDNALGNYKSALSLNPNFLDAKKNLEATIKAEKNLQSEIDSNKKIVDMLDSDAVKQKLENVAKMKEELKKLLRDDNNQNNQNQNQQQNQDNQQQQQNQQNQDQQQNQQQQQNNQEQKNDQNKNEQQNQDSKNKQNDKQNGKQDDKRDQQNDDAKRDQRDEQAVKNQQEKSDEKQKQKEAKQGDKQDKEKEQATENAVEQKQKDSENPQPTAGEKSEDGADKERENFRVTAGAMTKGEAKQLLESMKDSDKILPLRGYGEQKDRFEKSYKDW